MKKLLVFLALLLVPSILNAASAVPYVVNRGGMSTNQTTVNPTNVGVLTLTGTGAVSIANSTAIRMATPMTYTPAVTTQTNPVSAFWFGARGDGGTTDNTLPLQWAINQARGSGCDLELTPGIYWMSGSLNLTGTENSATNFQAMTIRAASSRHYSAPYLEETVVICGGSNGYPMLDCSGNNGIRIEGIAFNPQRIGGSYYRLPSCAVLFGRVGLSEAQNHRLYNCQFDGDYTMGGVVTMASEIVDVENCWFSASGTNPHAMFWWGVSPTNSYETAKSLYQSFEHFDPSAGNGLLRMRNNVFWQNHAAGDRPDNICIGVDSPTGDINLEHNFFGANIQSNVIVFTNSYPFRTNATFTFHPRIKLEDFRVEYSTTTPHIWFTGSNNWSAVSLINSWLPPVIADDGSYLQGVHVEGNQWTSTSPNVMTNVFDVWGLIDAEIWASGTNCDKVSGRTINGEAYRVRGFANNVRTHGIASWQALGFGEKSASDGRGTIYWGNDLRLNNAKLVVGTNTTSVLGQVNFQRDGTSGEFDTPALTISGQTNTTQQLRFGYDTDADYGFIRSVHVGVDAKPLVLWGSKFGVGVVPLYSALEVVGSGTMRFGVGGSADGLTLAGIYDDSSTANVQYIASNHLWKVGNYGATEAMRLNPSGWLGIGTNAPNVQFHVQGTAAVRTTATDGQAQALELQNVRNVGGNTKVSQRFLSDSVAVDLIAGRDAPGTASTFDLQTMVGGTLGTAIYVDAARKVGIGTNNPQAALHVNGTVLATAFAGDGSGLTNLPSAGSSNITDSGYVAVARNLTVNTNLIVTNNGVSTVIASNKVWTGTQTNTGPLVLTTGDLRLDGGQNITGSGELGIIPNGTLTLRANTYGSLTRIGGYGALLIDCYNDRFEGTGGGKWAIYDATGNFITKGTVTATNGFVLTTNTVNTGVLPLGKVTFTNLTSDITIAGFSGVDFSVSQDGTLVATNGTATDHSITWPAGVSITPTNTAMVAGLVTWVSNRCKVRFPFVVDFGDTNVGVVGPFNHGN